MHVTDLGDQPSPLAASSAPPFHPRSGETSSWRLTRLAADLGNGITQQTPGVITGDVVPGGMVWVVL